MGISNQSITSSVGRGGRNIQDDVTTIQTMINKVGPADGGPSSSKLAVDGLCGPKTTRAIQDFQLHHFGWKGADARIDPGRQTWERLKQLQPVPTRPAPIPRPKPVVKVTSTTIVFQQAGPGRTVIDGQEDFFFKVFPQGNRHLARLYWFGPPKGYLSVQQKPVFTGATVTIQQLDPPGASASGFECRAHYLTRASNRGRFRNALILRPEHVELGRRSIHVFVHRPLIGESRGVITRTGFFQLVENPERWLVS